VDRFLVDTNIIQGKSFFGKKLPTPLCFSVVVFTELMTACNDTKELKQYQKAWRDSVKENILIVPTENDWLEAARIQYLLAQDRKKYAGGKSPRRSARVKQEVALDCLIAVSCAREKITVLTSDGDFRAIGHYLKKLKIQDF
jgi:predicted nucleic acid-binding protein